MNTFHSLSYFCVVFTCFSLNHFLSALPALHGSFYTSSSQSVIRVYTVLAKLLLFTVKLSNVLSLWFGCFPPLYGFLIFLELMAASLFPYTQVSVYLSLIFFLHVLTEPSYISMIVLHTRTQQNVSFPFLPHPCSHSSCSGVDRLLSDPLHSCSLGTSSCPFLGHFFSSFLDPVSSLNNS